MTIRFLNNSIEFDDFTLTTTPTGFRFDGEIAARQFQQLFQGTIAGFGSGGEINAPLGTLADNSIDRFPFATDTNAVNAGSLAANTAGGAGASSTTHGYNAGGYTAFPPLVGITNLQKFSFSNATTGVNIGSLVQARGYVTGYSSAIEGFCSGGDNLGTTYSDFIEKFPFANDGSAAFNGSLSSVRRGTAGCNSQFNGYACGGESPGVTLVSTIDKFPLAGGASYASAVGNLTTAVRRTAGCSSQTNGYTVGGSLGVAAFTDSIQKFPFANETTATVTASLRNAGSPYTLGSTNGTHSSNTAGYSTGGGTGQSPPAPAPGVFTLINTIEKFSFVTDTNSTSIGFITNFRRSIAGHNY